MLFTEGRFFLFFGLVFALHWALRWNRARKLMLLAGSYVFYGAWDPRFLALILLSTVVDYAVGLAMERAKSKRRLLLGVSLVTNLGLLGAFKYYNFFAESAAELLRWFGFGASDWTLAIVLPVGISFYTFQTLSYTIDIYRGSLKPTRDPMDFALFVAFFPQLVAGPIVRAVDFLPQLDERRRWRDVEVRAMLGLFLAGFIKKACVADHLAPIADSVFSDPGAHSVGANWIGAAAYYLQIYCDFSGYSDMAIACAGLLGYRLTVNFRFPYLARDIAEFWRRWHISLSSWLRDYLYISLGGNRRGRAKTVRNLFVTMMLCGLWHGAGWQFVMFGLLHAIYLGVHRVWSSRRGEESAGAGLAAGAFGFVMTTLAVGYGWVWFRGESAETTLLMSRILIGLEPGGAVDIDLAWLAVFVGFAIVHVAMQARWGARFLERQSDTVWASVHAAGWALALPFVATGYTPFLYFQF